MTTPPWVGTAGAPPRLHTFLGTGTSGLQESIGTPSGSYSTTLTKPDMLRPPPGPIAMSLAPCANSYGPSPFGVGIVRIHSPVSSEKAMIPSGSSASRT